LLGYDLVGLHNERYMHNLVDSLDIELSGESHGDTYYYEGNATRLGVFPIGIDPDTFRPKKAHWNNGGQDDGSGGFNGNGKRSLVDELSLASTPDLQLILGVDRLDYTKGIPNRLRIFERMLERHPNLRNKLIYIQISSPSRTRVPEYVQEKEQVERLVGQINGRFSEAGWVPIRYLYRSYAQSDLASFYHDADVCLVTPLRDGMNLVAKEFVAAQSEDSPGVLVLSRFAGAASTMHDAVIVNPYDIDGTAEATYQALRMPLEERRRRNRKLLSVVEKHSSQNWSRTFTATLQAL
ncbi:MAG: trehalose-6-phosphate synthase, partial [Chloroflexi bacterium]|nr:trehalose-6-phosphate synthase [Chloroflexota bacterium]